MIIIKQNYFKKILTREEKQQNLQKIRIITISQRLLFFRQTFFWILPFNRNQKLHETNIIALLQILFKVLALDSTLPQKVRRWEIKYIYFFPKFMITDSRNNLHIMCFYQVDNNIAKLFLKDTKNGRKSTKSLKK